jgi:hypothetical protein
MVLNGMRGAFEERGLLDGIGDIGFELPGFIKDIGKSAASAALTASAQKLTGAPKPAAAPPPAASKAGLSSGAKIAIVGGGILGLVLLLRRPGGGK